MELKVLVSKKGTKVVTATNLYHVLELPTQHYGTTVKKWIHDVYEFSDGIRKPVAMKDFARRIIKENPVIVDYFISIHLAKKIALRSKSKVKQKFANQLSALMDKTEDETLLNKQQILAIIQLAKAMGHVSCQEFSEREHLKVYEERNNGKANNWWKHRAQLLGYSTQSLRKKVKSLGYGTVGKSQRGMLMQLDKLEMVRSGVIDLFMAMGKSEGYAKNLGELAKVFARELGVEIFDDRNITSALMGNSNVEAVKELKNFKQGELLSPWN